MHSPLADFLRNHSAAILHEWEAEVRQLPAAQRLSQLALRDHLPQLLQSIASALSGERRGDVTTALGLVPDMHALERQSEGFDLRQVVKEYQLLRRCVLRLWGAQGAQDGSVDSMESASIFHEAVDEAVGAAVSRYMRVRERTVQALDRVSAAAIGSPDLPTLMPRMLQVLQETMPVVDTVAVLLVEGDTLRVESSVGLSLEEDLRVRMGEGISGEVAATRLPVLVRNAATDPRVRSEALRQSGLRAVYAVPLMLEEELLGVAHMGSRSSHEFSDEDLLLFRTMAARTTSLIARARAHASAQRAHEQVEHSLGQLRASEAQRKRWEEIFSHLGVGVALTSADTNMLEDVNPAFARMHGATREELVGRPLADVVAPESRGVLARHVAAAQSKLHHEYEAIHLRKDGSRMPVLTHVTTLRDESGKGVQRAATFLDITHRRNAEAERQRLLTDIEAERSRLAAVLDQLPTGVMLAEAPEGRMLMGNRQVENILGMPFIQAEHVGEYSQYPGFHPDGRPYLAEEYPLARSVRSGEVVQGEEIEIRRPDGKRVVILCSSSPIRDRAGKISSAVVAFVDVTALRRAEAAARQAAEFGGKLIGIASHDLRNPLNAIHLSVTQLLHSETLTPRDQRAAARIAKSVDRMKRMIEELLDFTRLRLGGGIPIHPSPADIRAVLRQGVEELEAAWPERTLNLKVEPGRYEGAWDADRLAQVVSNLGGNALQYSPSEAPVLFNLVDRGERVVLEVHNGGNPIPAEALPHLFDPFRRVSSEGGGLGLGLYIVEQVVKGHGGHIEVVSTAEAGTTFRVVLPRVTAGSQSAPAA